MDWYSTGTTRAQSWIVTAIDCRNPDTAAELRAGIEGCSNPAPNTTRKSSILERQQTSFYHGGVTTTQRLHRSQPWWTKGLKITAPITMRVR